MGDAKSGTFYLSFNSRLPIERHLADLRIGRNRQFPLADLFRQSICSRLTGYADTLSHWNPA